MGTARCAPTFVILRGNSASGKSTVARRVQRARPRGEVAVIGQDHVRRELLWEHDSGQGDTVGLLGTMVRHCLGIGRITLLEGIFGAERYQGMFARMLEEAPGPCLVYYLDVSLPETLRRHAGKPIAGHVPAEEVASWYRPHDVLGVPGEQVLGEELDEEQMVERVLADLARHDAGSSRPSTVEAPTSGGSRHQPVQGLTSPPSAR